MNPVSSSRFSRLGLSASCAALALLAAHPFRAAAQPVLSVPSVNAACASGPAATAGIPDTVPSAPDADGFYSLFDGKSLKGWWENCLTGHSSQDRTLGGIWLADSAHGALYSQQAGTQAGSVLMTNKSWEHYELIFDFWPAWGNDAGVFNRVVPTGSAAGRTYQTGLDYKQGSSIGGSYGEGGYGNFNIDPYVFTSGFGVITVSSWAAFTAARDPASFGCPQSGCGVAQWHAVWDTAGWNQVRVKFFGGLVAGSPTRMQAWIRRVNNPPVAPPNNWVPTHDSAMNTPAPANPIGLQIHGGSASWNRAGRGTWYRDIRIRPLDASGNPAVTSLAADARPFAGALRLVGGALVGHVEGRHEILVRDAGGRLRERFASHEGGAVGYALAGGSRGILIVEVRAAQGATRYRFLRM